jgi:hypothetical protein
MPHERYDRYLELLEAVGGTSVSLGYGFAKHEEVRVETWVTGLIHSGTRRYFTHCSARPKDIVADLEDAPDDIDGNWYVDLGDEWYQALERW